MTIILDTVFKELFQKNIQLTLKNKTYKKGRLINFRVSGCYISLVMQTEKKKETFEIPFPFAVKRSNSNVVFDYTLESLAEQDIELLVNLQTVTKIKNCKFYNTVLAITTLN